MGLYTLFVILIVIASILMIGIVLIQESKGGGLASNFSSSNQIMGVRKTTDFIEKATWALAIAMVVFSVVCAYVAPTTTTEKSALENTQENSAANPNNLPNFGASQQH
jgi:preprotein translocase subunit SecG